MTRVVVIILLAPRREQSYGGHVAWRISGVSLLMLGYKDSIKFYSEFDLPLAAL